MAENLEASQARITAVENADGGGNGRSTKTRVKISFTQEAFDLMWKEQRRHGWSPSDAVNYMLSELDDWRSGRRRFVERRKAQR